MATIITKELALRIAAKLGATLEKGGAHSIAYVYHRGLLVASFGIRHGSRKGAGHDHVPSDIHLSLGKAKRLGQCAMSKEQWIESLREKGIIPHEEDQGDKPGTAKNRQ
jgi:hypothetical protein